MKRIDDNNGSVLYEKATAMLMVDKLQEGDPEWTYTIEPISGRFYRIKVFDEENEFLGYFEMMANDV